MKENVMGLLAFATTAISQGNADLRGTAGMCVRWDRPAHVADAVVVVSSRNPTLDAALPETIKAMKEWPAPQAYDGRWVGINISVAGDTDDRPLPDCSLYRLPKP